MISIPFPIFHHPYVPSRERRCVRTDIVSVESPRFTRLCMVVYNNLLRVSFNISLWINLLLLLLLLLHFFTLVRLPTFPNVRGRFMEVEEEVFSNYLRVIYFSESLLNWQGCYIIVNTRLMKARGSKEISNVSLTSSNLPVKWKRSPPFLNPLK